MKDNTQLKDSFNRKIQFIKDMNLPNKLTLFRIALVPLLILIMEMNFKYKFIVGCIIFIVASVTDFLDGKIARKYQLITDFGKFMDPLADKLLVLSTFICMVDSSLIGGWVVAIIVCREMAVSIIRAIAGAEGKVIAAAKSGKLKTATQMLSIVVVLIGAQFCLRWIVIFGDILVGLAVIFTLYSGYEYLNNNKFIFIDVK